MLACYSIMWRRDRPLHIQDVCWSNLLGEKRGGGQNKMLVGACIRGWGVDFCDTIRQCRDSVRSRHGCHMMQA